MYSLKDDILQEHFGVYCYQNDTRCPLRLPWLFLTQGKVSEILGARGDELRNTKKFFGASSSLDAWRFLLQCPQWL